MRFHVIPITLTNQLFYLLNWFICILICILILPIAEAVDISDKKICLLLKILLLGAAWIMVVSSKMLINML